MTGPPLSISMDFIANGMVEMTGGIASAVILSRIMVGAAGAGGRLVGNPLAAA